MIKLALAGNPNSGKTTLFNDLTGASQYVGNWPGVTVEKKEGRVKGDREIHLVDLPGIYSLSPYTLEEVVSRNFLLNEKPDAIINIVDATNLERNLYLTTQLVELGIPVIIALNMMDIIKKKGEIINTKKLEEQIGCKVVEISALKGEGTKNLISEAKKVSCEKKKIDIKHTFDSKVEKSLIEIEEIIKGKVKEDLLHWYSIKLYERDEKVLEKISLNREDKKSIETIIEKSEKEFDDDSESIITNERYTYITSIIDSCFKKRNKSLMSTSDKIDRIVTNRILAIPIFAIVMYLVYYISISTIGTAATDWVNDVLFGENGIPGVIGSFLVSVGVAEWLQSLILDGIVAGVGAVLGFLPQMLVLFLCLAILEDCGYMARVAFIMDRIFRKFGLSGKSFIPMLIGTGCGVPGVMASRTIENERDRKITIMTTTFVPCSAKLPIIALIAGALFPGATWVGPSAYFLGIAAIVCSGIILKKTRRFAGDPAPFVMELPAYHIPGAKSVLIHMWDRAKSFVKKAGTIIFLACALIWFLQSFGFENGSFGMVEMDNSLLKSIGSLIAPLFAPLGFGDWKAAVATVTGLIAKENVVGTFGILYGFAEVAEDGAEIWANVAAAFTPLAAYAFLAFNLLSAPCFAAIGAMHREFGNGKWTLFAVAYQCLLAYCTSLSIYQIGMFVTGHGFTILTAVAFLVVIGFIYLLVRPYKEKYDLSGKEALLNA
ncbi:ferrous iron transport protein B [Anaerofustis stercorihominis]|uniref:ferrous iron transport protein B n=1 Tax=Anaerofustis stercorihominis TaxID=214853 RepID=UPI00210F014E|nr:ferrous iron transport protein B [Anaerofustis stercorihominis]MCQ4794058.1 ferrous iron transport protein B [Anaerofustis stercorihominis]